MDNRGLSLLNCQFEWDNPKSSARFRGVAHFQANPYLKITVFSQKNWGYIIGYQGSNIEHVLVMVVFHRLATHFMDDEPNCTMNDEPRS